MTLQRPGALQVALLHRRERRIDDRHRHAVFGNRMALQRDLTLAKQGGGAAGAQRHDGGMDDDEADRGRQSHRLGEARFGGARLLARQRSVVIRSIPRQDDRRPVSAPAAPFRPLMDWPPSVPAAGLISRRRAAAPSALAASNSWIGAPGITVLMACL